MTPTIGAIEVGKVMHGTSGFHVIAHFWSLMDIV